MNRRAKILCLATYLSMGTYLTQLAGCFEIAANTAVAAFPLPNYLPEPGLLALCGTPNIIIVNADGTQQGEVLNTGDDLVYFCPVTPVVEAPNSGGGGGGG